MDQFHDGHHVRLRSRVHRTRTYLHAAADGESVTLSQVRASMNAAWAVHIYNRADGDGEGFYDDDGPYLLLHSAAYGRYLGATDVPARRGHHGFRAELRDYDQPEVGAIMWRAVGSGFAGNVVLLHHAGGRFLRANGRYLPWNAGVSLDDDVNSMMHWVVEPIPAREAGMPAIPGPLPNRPGMRFLSNIFMHRGPGQQVGGVEPIQGESGMPGRPSTLPRFLSNMFTEPGRRIRYTPTLGGDYPEDSAGWGEFWFRGRSVFRLRDQVVMRTSINLYYQNIAMCVRAGRYGRLTPLVVDLPHGGYGETLEIVILEDETRAYDDLRHPDIDAE
ncbi:unnamed protein product [Triticum aestivum]|uniref:DUF569 domain-containing protein n=3 Tax=Triticinae TaxID=1648030 RepID=A0A9R1EPC9_WHEAT|nr:uncharacterized protein LOC109773194 [Aegilops tauschii subsp. strangulata]XP_044330665.1 uncharacterized protein LOC123051758 [Triticum aestivum]KAF7014352.1 hypothetical protein CFC21_028356 [Triticum aestivum]SPT16584.1 unnamed protein product [Triticum aestivum]